MNGIAIEICCFKYFIYDMPNKPTLYNFRPHKWRMPPTKCIFYHSTDDYSNKMFLIRTRNLSIQRFVLECTVQKSRKKSIKKRKFVPKRATRVLTARSDI